MLKWRWSYGVSLKRAGSAVVDLTAVTVWRSAREGTLQASQVSMTTACLPVLWWWWLAGGHVISPTARCLICIQYSLWFLTCQTAGRGGVAVGMSVARHQSGGGGEGCECGTPCSLTCSASVPLVTPCWLLVSAVAFLLGVYAVGVSLQEHVNSNTPLLLRTV